MMVCHHELLQNDERITLSELILMGAECELRHKLFIVLLELTRAGPEESIGRESPADVVGAFFVPWIGTVV